MRRDPASSSVVTVNGIEICYHTLQATRQGIAFATRTQLRARTRSEHFISSRRLEILQALMLYTTESCHKEHLVMPPHLQHYNGVWYMRHLQPSTQTIDLGLPRHHPQTKIQISRSRPSPKLLESRSCTLDCRVSLTATTLLSYYG